MKRTTLQQRQKRLREKNSPEGRKSFSRKRHKTRCQICRHPEREAIDQAFIDWSSIVGLARNYGITRDTIYRHAHAVGLFEKRQRNIRRALERLIEQVEDVQANATSVVTAVQTYARINARGEWVERPEGMSLNELFDRMSIEELDAYAKGGMLPEWFSLGTPTESEMDEDDS
jgi:hypothetical protein